MGMSHSFPARYSLAENFIPERRLLADPSATPGVYFYYDFYPVTIEVAKQRKSLPEFAVEEAVVERRALEREVDVAVPQRLHPAVQDGVVVVEPERDVLRDDAELPRQERRDLRVGADVAAVLK